MRHNYLYAAAALAMASACTAPYYSFAADAAETVTFDNMKFEYTDSSKTELRLVSCECTPEMADSNGKIIVCVPGVIGNAKVTSIDPAGFTAKGGCHPQVWVPRSAGYDEDTFKKASEAGGYNIIFNPCTAAADGFIFEKSEEVAGELILTHCFAVGDIIVPDVVDGMPVTGIGSEAFEGNMDIRDVTLPDSICYMGRSAFYDSSVRSVNIPKQLYIIPKQAFQYCEQLETVVLHENITRIDPEAFGGCPYKLPEEYEKLLFGIDITGTDIDIDGSTDDWRYTIDSRKGSSRLILTKYTGKATELVLPTKLVSSDVYGCRIDLPDYVDTLTVPEGIKEIDVSRMEDVMLRKLIMKDGSTGISGRFNDSVLEEAVISGVSVDAGGMEVPVWMFEDCRKLKKVSFISGADEFLIQNGAFMDCSSLTSIDLPSNVVSADIRRNAFDGCSSMTELGDLGKLSSVYTETRSFAGTGLASADLNKWTVGAYCFSSCEDMTEVAIKDSTVGESAFQNCTSLKNAAVSGSTNLMAKVFDGCPALENVDIGEDVTSAYSFKNCTSLYKINGIDAYDTKKKDFTPECADLVYKHFSGSDDIGFLNLYVKDKVKDVVAETVTEDMTDIEKVRVLHDWVCRNAEYDLLTPDDKLNHADLSLFLRGVTVCEGYARALDLLLQEAGVDSCCVSSSDHEWNIVRIGDQCFHVDTTWDDDEEICYDWFLKSDEEVASTGGSHASWKFQGTSSIHKTCFETMPRCSYAIGDVNKDGAKNVADLVKMSSYLLGKGGLDKGSEALSDLNFDGRTDSFDMVFLRKKLIVD